MVDVLMLDLPEKTKEISGCWSLGYPIHCGLTENSMNYVALHSNKNNILPDQEKIQKEHLNLKKTFEDLGLNLKTFEFPKELNSLDNLKHDAIFLRDSFFIFDKYFIKANFSCKDRSIESDVLANIIAKQLDKEILEPNENEYIEFGEVYYLKTKNKTYYFGGLSRANEAGHNFMKNILNPDEFILLKSKGYHLDTVFSPVLNNDNELCAIIYTKNLMSKEAIKKLEELNIELIPIDLDDSIGDENIIGNCAVNSFIKPGIFISASEFKTKDVEKKLTALGIKHVVCAVNNFLNAGGAIHCLTNEIF